MPDPGKIAALAARLRRMLTADRYKTLVAAAEAGTPGQQGQTQAEIDWLLQQGEQSTEAPR